MKIPTEPVPLRELAAFMRDGSWLDLGTENGTLSRVRITQIRVRPDGDDLTLRQEWFDGERLERREMDLDCEAVWRAVPTRVELLAMRPPRLRLSGPGAPAQTFGEILRALSEFGGATHEDLTVGARKTDYRTSHYRHGGILLQYGMTEEGEHQICGRFGYASPQPFYTARDKLRRDAEAKTGLSVLVTKLSRRLDGLAGTRRRRPGLAAAFPELHGAMA